MDIKMMHEMIEKLTECAKSEMDKKGIEEIDTEEFGKVTDIIKDLAKSMYYRTLTEAMKESEYGEEYDEYGAYDDGRRGYRGQPRDSKGRYMSRRGRKRMGYDEPPYWHMDEMYDKDEMERGRDLDRHTMNRMYYTEPITTGSRHDSTGSMDNVNRGTSRYENARRGYEEKKTTGADKQEKMKSLEEYMKELSTDVSSMVTEMSPEEKTLMKQKMSVLMSKIQ